MKKVTAFLSVYPLRQEEVTPGIGAALDALAETGIEHEIGTMGTLLWGEDEKVFKALLGAFRCAAAAGKTTMVVTVSNACPYPDKNSSGSKVQGSE
jgi:uncharacterized protein YqgV (UPF0045/DUF77 family)